MAKYMADVRQKRKDDQRKEELKRQLNKGKKSAQHQADDNAASKEDGKDKVMMKRGKPTHRDPNLTLHIYVARYEGASATPKRVACPKTVWEKFRLAFWQLGLRHRQQGHVAPKIIDWDYHSDHGIVRLALV